MAPQTPNVRNRPGDPGRFSISRGFPETFGDAGGLVGGTDGVEVARDQQADLGEGLEYRALAIDDRKRDAWQPLPLRLQPLGDGLQLRVEVLAPLLRTLDDRR